MIPRLYQPHLASIFFYTWVYKIFLFCKTTRHVICVKKWGVSFHCSHKHESAGACVLFLPLSFSFTHAHTHPCSCSVSAVFEHQVHALTTRTVLVHFQVCRNIVHLFRNIFLDSMRNLCYAFAISSLPVEVPVYSLGGKGITRRVIFLLAVVAPTKWMQCNLLI